MEDSREKQIYKITIIGSVCNFLLLVFKFIAGFVGRSNAMVADAIHSLSDFVTDIIVLAFTKIANKPQDQSHNYGHSKFETLATAIIGIVLLSVGIVVFYEGINKIINVYNGEILEKPDNIAFYAAIVSIISKEILYRYTKKIGNNLKSQIVIVNAWHHRSDALSSIGTAVGIAGAIFLGEKWRILDPIMAIIVSFFIVKIAIKLVVPAVNDLLEKSLPQIVNNQILDIINSVEGVKMPHNLKTRKIGNNYAIEVHIRVDGNLSIYEGHEKATEVENKLKDIYGNHTHVAIHVEPVRTSYI